MRREAPQKLTDYAPLAFPAGMLIVFFVVPFATMIAVSFFRRDPAGFYSPDFVFDNYARFLSLFFGKVLGFSLFLAVAVAICCVVVALPFTYLLSRTTRRTQVLWLVALLSVGIGILNLLPIPPLDGGHLAFYAYEAVFRRPVSERMMEAVYRTGMFLVLGFMAFVFWNDLFGC